jgi:PKD repeat protein
MRSIFARRGFALPRLKAFSRLAGGRMLAVLGLVLAGAILQAGLAQAAQAAPTASFVVTPQAPLTHQELTFTSTSVPGGLDQIVKQEWDLDDDDLFDDATGAMATWTFTRPGPHTVGLRVTDSAQVSDTKRIRLGIGNRTPVPSVVTLPAAPAPGQQVTFLSNSYDPDGFIAGYAWDIDNDGAFDDGTGASVSASFSAGRHTVGLRVTDDSGDSASSTTFLEVSGVSAFAGPLLSPFPIVRVSGIVQRRGIKLRVLSVSGPVGVTVHVRCSGRGCPFKRTSSVVKSDARAAATLPPQTGRVQIKRFRNRLLRVGAIVRIFVTKQGAVGKYTRLRIRRGKPPARVDRCVTSVTRKPFPCP